MTKLDFSSANSFLIIGQIDVPQLIAQTGVDQTDYRIVQEEVLKIQDVRDLIHWLHLKPLNSSIKLLVINRADTMTGESANAFLKTLEEPPPYAKIVLVSLFEKKILPTIQSRCQKTRLPLMLDQEDTENYLSPQKLANLNIKERFDWVNSVAENDREVMDILTLWQIELRKNLLGGEDKIALLENVNRAKDLLGTNISVKLLLENLVLEM